MARGVNKVILVGNLGQDPDVKYMPSGSAVANVSLATTDSWKDKQTGQQQDRTEWHRVVFYGRLAEIVGEYLKKGAQIYVEGRLQTRKWTDKHQVDRYTTEIIAQEMQMLGGRGNGAPSAAGSGGGATPDQYRQASGGGYQQPPPNIDDDVPF